jgi:hypothetical protein
MRRLSWIVAPALLASLVGCGTFNPPPVDEDTGLERSCLDAWSLAHAVSGAAIGEVLNDQSDGFAKGLAALVGWEFVEPHIWPGWNESGRNQVCDIVIGTITLLMTL